MTPSNEVTERALYDAVAKLIKAKGRFHTEQNYAALVKAFDACTPTAAIPRTSAEAATVGWLIEWTSEGGIKSYQFHKHNTIGDYRYVYSDVTATELVRRATPAPADSAAEDCTLCESMGMLDGSGAICPHCNGSGKEPDSAAKP